MTNQNRDTRDRDRNRRTSAAAGGTPISSASDPTPGIIATTAAATVDTSSSTSCDTSSASPSVDCGGSVGG